MTFILNQSYIPSKLSKQVVAIILGTFPDAIIEWTSDSVPMPILEMKGESVCRISESDTPVGKPIAPMGDASGILFASLTEEIKRLINQAGK